MKNNSATLIGLAVGAVGLAFGLYSQYQMHKVSKKLDVAIDDLDLKTSVDISKDIVDAATKQAVDREVSTVAHKAALAVSVEVTSELRKEVRDAVNAKFDDLSAKVTEEISAQVANIDKDAMTNRISKRAEQKVVDKFEHSLDGVLENYNHELKNVGRIYQSIAETMRRDDRPSYLKMI